jgi:hypothetical protein
MSKDLSSNKLNSIYGDIIHFGRDLNDLLPKERIYDGIGNDTGISTKLRSKVDVKFSRGDLDSPVFCKKIYRGYNFKEIQIPNINNPSFESFENNLFLDIDNYSSFYLEFLETDAINEVTINLLLISKFMDFTASGYYYRYGFFDNSKNPPVLKTPKPYAFWGNTDENNYDSAIIIPNDIINTNVVWYETPNPNWTVAARVKPFEKIDPRVSVKTFYIFVKNSSSEDIDSKNIFQFRRSYPTRNIPEQLGGFDYIVTLGVVKCTDLINPECEIPYEAKWKISSGETSMFEIIIPEPTFYIPNVQLEEPPFFINQGAYGPDDEEYYGFPSYHYFIAATNRVSFRKVF